MTEILTNIEIGTTELLTGDLRKRYTAIVLLSDKLKTEELPKGTFLPTLLKYKIGANNLWDGKMQTYISEFLLGYFHKAVTENKSILICSDDDTSRPLAAMVRLLIKLGFKKSDAVNIVASKTDEPANETVVSNFPDSDSKRIPDTVKAAQGPKAMIGVMANIMTGFGIAKEHANLLPENVAARKPVIGKPAEEIK